MDAMTLLQAIGGPSAAAGIVYGGYRYIRPRVTPFIAALAALADLPPAIAEIQHELKPNSGGSFRDEFRRVAQDVRLIGASQRAYQDHQDRAVFECDAAGRNTWVSSTYARIAQRTVGDLLGFGWVNAVHEDDRDDIRADWDAAVREEREFRAHYRMVNLDGESFEVDTIARPVMDPANGVVCKWVGGIRRREQRLPRHMLEDNGS